MLLYSLGTKFLDENMRVQVFPVYFDSFLFMERKSIFLLFWAIHVHGKHTRRGKIMQLNSKCVDGGQFYTAGAQMGVYVLVPSCENI